MPFVSGPIVVHGCKDVPETSLRKLSVSLTRLSLSRRFNNHIHMWREHIEKVRGKVFKFSTFFRVTDRLVILHFSFRCDGIMVLALVGHQEATLHGRTC
jgi:hypothetical protein